MGGHCLELLAQLLAAVSEQLLVHCQGELYGLAGDPAAVGGQPQSQRAGIAGVGLAGYQAAFLQGPQDFGGHHPVGSGVVGDLLLRGRRRPGTVQPADRAEQVELGRGEPERPQRAVEPLPPLQRGVVQPEARAHQRPARLRHGPAPGTGPRSPAL